MTRINIPPAAVEAGAKVLWPQWDEDDVWGKQCAMRDARAAFEAMVAAWPKWLDMDADPGAALILPLPTEASDE